MSRYYPTAADKASWPEGHKRCSTCLEVKPFSEFHKHRTGCLGYNHNCKECRKPVSRSQYESLAPELLLWQRAKSRAKKRGLEFNIDVSDVVIPELCPVFGVRLERGTLGYDDNSPSLDRFDSSRGYVKGNIVVISARANRMKFNATIEELQALVRWMALEEFKRKELVGV
jgi:hypothetical protein